MSPSQGLHLWCQALDLVEGAGCRGGRDMHKPVGFEQ
jgi:hypothetical protein